MITVCVLFPQRDINLKLNHPPNILIGEDGKITDVAFHKDDEESMRYYLRYIDWGAVAAIVQYAEPNKSGSVEGRTPPQPTPKARTKATEGRK